MSDLILHQYAESPFSEKVRLLLGYKGVSYQSVEIPIIMPRPDLMPLTGGYRKTPVLQIGADIYCDSAIICHVINEMYPDNNIYPEGSIAAIETMAYWTDTFFFKVCVAVAFQPKAAATNPLFQDEQAAAAFMADRAEFSKGSSELGMAFEVAEPHFVAHLNNLDRQLGEGAGFLFGDQPVIADFSTFHNCWFIYTRDVLRDYFSPFEHLLSWYERMQGFGHGTVEKIEGSAALSHANSVQPQELRDSVFLDTVIQENVIQDKAEPGQQVSVMPIDYGFQPVNGELLSAGLDEIVIARTDDNAGRVLVHFPRMGFQIT